MVRRILAVVAGVAVAVTLVVLIQKFGHSLYPPPVNMDISDQEFLRDYVASLPWGPLAFVISSYVMATLVGGWVAAAIAGEAPMIYAGIVAVFVLAGSLSTVYLIPHPAWFTIASVLGIILAAMVAAYLASNVSASRKVI